METFINIDGHGMDLEDYSSECAAAKREEGKKGEDTYNPSDTDDASFHSRESQTENERGRE